MRLFHYCCACSVAQIGRKGVLKPQWHPLLSEPLVWLTDMAIPQRLALGLTSLGFGLVLPFIIRFGITGLIVGMVAAQARREEVFEQP